MSHEWNRVSANKGLDHQFERGRWEAGRGADCAGPDITSLELYL